MEKIKLKYESKPKVHDSGYASEDDSERGTATKCEKCKQTKQRYEEQVEKLQKDIQQLSQTLIEKKQKYATKLDKYKSEYSKFEPTVDFTAENRELNEILDLSSCNVYICLYLSITQNFLSQSYHSVFER